MRRYCVAMVSVIAIAATTPALAANCGGGLTNLNKKISSNENDYRVVADAGLTSEIRQLRDAATIFSRNGQDDACQAVVDGIEARLEQRRGELSDGKEIANRDSWFESGVSRLKTAVPVSGLSQPLRASDVIGADLRNAENKDLGEIDDIIVSQKESGAGTQYAIVSSGGFLGLGEKRIAVPWDELKVTTEGDNPIFVLNVSEEALKNAPSFERNAWPDVDSDAWRKQNDDFYKTNRL